MGHDINVETFINIIEFDDSNFLNLFLKSIDYNYSYSKDKPSLINEIEDYYNLWCYSVDKDLIFKIV